MKKNILTFIAFWFVFICQAQRPVPEPVATDDYYLNFWKQNLDSISQRAELPFNFQTAYPAPVIPGYSEKDYKEIIAQLNSDLPLRYDSRVGDILSFYIQNAQQSAFAVAYSKSMEPAFQKVFEEANMPTILKYLPLALTAMNNQAIGQTGSAGLWQLMYSTARKEGLVIDSYVDERRNIEKATSAAASELKQLFELYQNWELALGAFACGPSNVNKSIRRMENQQDYYMLYPQLPEFGRDIVPALTAAAILCQYHDDFKISLPDVNFSIVVDTVEVSQRLHFKQLNEVLHISLDSLRFLNPQYKHDIVPAIHEVYQVYLPKGYLSQFNALEDSIYHYNDSILFELKKPVILPPRSKTRHYASYEPQKVPDGSALVYYHIKSGDNLGFVASWYDVKVSRIEDWNNVYDPRKIQIGKKLKIYVPEEKEAYYKVVDDLSFEAKQKRIGKESSSNGSSAKKEKKEEPLGKDWFYHTVKSGESPYTIAKKYDGVSPEDIVRWNDIDPKYIKAGQKLKIKKQ